MFSFFRKRGPDDGVQVVRQFLGLSDVEELRATVVAAYATIEKNGSAEAKHRIGEWGGLYLHEAPDAREYMLRKIEKRVRGELGRATFVPELSLFRRHVKTSSHIPWHIDADGAGAAMHDPCFNVWIPLSDVGVNLPSLQFVRGSNKAMRAVPLRNPQNAARDDLALGLEVFTAVLAAGDAVIFDHYTLHRTQPMLEPKGIRISSEFRFTLKR